MMFLGSKIVPNLSEMEFRTFVRIQKVIWEQLMALILRLKLSEVSFLNIVS